MVEILATINATEKSVDNVCNYLKSKMVRHRVVSTGNSFQIKLLASRSEIAEINKFLERQVTKMGAAEALNYDYDVIDTPTETPTTDKIVRCFTDSELNDELANLLKDSLAGVRKANLEDHGLEIRKRNRELIIREKKKQKLLSMVELSMMIFVLLLIPVLGTVIVREAVYLWLYIITGPVAAYLINQLRKMQEEV